MRIALGMSMLVLGLAGATAANAGTTAEAPLPVVDKVTPIAQKVGSDFRVRVDMLTTSARIDPLGDPEGPVHHRFASSMIEYYPFGGNSGLHLSGGMRFFTVANFLKDAEKATGGLLFSPRLPGSGAGNVRTGFSRHTPAATVGYTGTIKNAMFGFEIGSLIGNANANLPRSFSMASNRRSGGINPIANLVLGLRF